MDNFQDMMRVNRNASIPPIVFAAANVQFHVTDSRGSQIWTADIKACRHGVQCDVFNDVLFVESNGTAFIFGMECEDGYPKEIDPVLAREQEFFIQFLRRETAKNAEALGLLASAFSGSDYACEGKATAAYLVIRNVKLNIGIGYRNIDGKYERVTIDSSEGWFDNASSILPFDQLGKD